MLLRCCRTRPDGLLHVFATIGIGIGVGVDGVGVGDNIFGVGGAIDTDFDVGIGEYAIFEAAVGVDGLAFVFYDRYFAQSLGTYHSKAPDMVLSSLLIKIDRCAVAGFLTAVAKIIFSSFSKPSPPSVPKICNYLLLGARTVLLAKTVFYKDEDWTLQCKSHLVKPRQ